MISRLRAQSQNQLDSVAVRKLQIDKDGRIDSRRCARDRGRCREGDVRGVSRLLQLHPDDGCGIAIVLADQDACDVRFGAEIDFITGRPLPDG